MSTIAQDATKRADIKEDRKAETLPPVTERMNTALGGGEVKAEATPAPTPTQAKKKAVAATPAKQTPVQINGSGKEVRAKAKKTDTKAAAKPDPKAKPAQAKPAQAASKEVPVDARMPKPLAGAAPIYLLFAAKRQENIADNRRNESLNNMQSQLFLGVSVDKTILENAKANYAKEFPHLYFWISTKKVLGEMPKDLGLALQFENVLIARGVM
jgi:hypothetical protein